ncbi:LAGLIDADG family homing endonuclease [Streptomyces chartreusis]|uniref:LAGLIDADG family homing endonuclease n=1 Tax=Streptomyces chartreusis TaxID=1969 RepID=UPI00362DDC5A
MDLKVPEYAYMFGFLQADGHLAKGAGQKGRLTVEITVRDIELLRKFQKLTPYYSSITERTRTTNFSKTHTSAVWSMCSLEARTKLNELGLPYGRKSTTIAPPDVEFSRCDYLRGILDADGSVGYTSQGFPFISLTTKSTEVAVYTSSYARENTGAERTLKRNARDGIYNILYTKENAQQLAAQVYYPGCLSLERKQIAADSLGRWVRPAEMERRTPRIQWTAEMDRILLAAPTIAHAAAELGYSPSPCQNRGWKLLHGVVPMPD